MVLIADKPFREINIKRWYLISLIKRIAYGISLIEVSNGDFMIMHELIRLNSIRQTSRDLSEFYDCRVQQDKLKRILEIK